jgi:transglutaminase-like putative cysteine protease
MKNNSSTPTIFVRWWDWLSGLLLAAVLLTIASRLEATRWTTNLNITQFLILLGALLGLALGRSRFGPRLVAFLALAYGVIIVPWQLGLLQGSGITWEDRLNVMGSRINLIVTQVADKQNITDSFLFLIMMAVLFWFLGVYAGYALTRYAEPWRMLLPTGLTLFVIQYYYNCPYNSVQKICVEPGLSLGIGYLIIFLVLALLLLARLSYIRKNWAWQQSRTYVSPDVSYDLSRLAVLMVAIMISVAWTAPTASAEPLPEAARLVDLASEPFRAINEFLKPLFGAIRATVGLVADVYSDDLSLGVGTQLGDAPVLKVEAPRVLAMGARYYWRVRVYDRYDRDGWHSSFSETQLLRPEGQPDLEPPDLVNRFSTVISFTPYNPIQSLFVVTEPTWVNRVVKVELANNPDGTVDAANWDVPTYVASGDTYDVRAALATVTIKELRAASVEYPAWVTERYLQLPDTITPRTRDLARQITDGLDNPYDKVQAITDYLRDTIEYIPSIDTPPLEQDRVDWFLFDYRKGYCTYYASAEIVMLRSIGIPARLAAGYAQGERQVGEDAAGPVQQPGSRDETAGSDVFVVRQRDAHAWVEVYFPQYGWIEFEPTVSQVPIRRPSGEAPSDPNLADNQNNPEIPERERPYIDDLGNQPDPSSQVNSQAGKAFPSTLSLWAFGGIVLILTAALVIWRAPVLVILNAGLRRLGLQPPHLLTRWEVAAHQSPPLPAQIETGLRHLGLHPPGFLLRWAYYASLPALTRSYLEVNRALARLGHKTTVEDTPTERVMALVGLLPQAESPASRLLVEYQAATYSPRSANVQEAQRAGREIRKLSYLALLQRWLTQAQEEKPHSRRVAGS